MLMEEEKYNLADQIGCVEAQELSRHLSEHTEESHVDEELRNGVSLIVYTIVSV